MKFFHRTGRGSGRSEFGQRLVPRINNADGLIGAGHFRAAIAPVYLRRNQSDVLEELPPRVDTQEWVELRGRDWEAYRVAVAAGNFMAMRRAAYAPGHPADSAKLGRLVEIVEEASAPHRMSEIRWRPSAGSSNWNESASAWKLTPPKTKFFLTNGPWFSPPTIV